MNEPSPIYGEVSRLRAVNAELLAALQGVLDAEQQFLDDTGLITSDMVSDACKVGRAAIAKAQP